MTPGGYEKKQVIYKARLYSFVTWDMNPGPKSMHTAKGCSHTHSLCTTVEL